MCRGAGDPHILTFDNAKSDVYGVAQYLFAQHNGTVEGAPAFKILMNTKKLRHVSAIEYMYFAFPTRVGEMIEIETDRYGGSRIFLNGAWIQLYPQKNADFLFKKWGKGLYVRTWFGVDIFQRKMYYRVRIPAFYQNETYGLCMNCNKNKYDDYMKKDGTVIVENARNEVQSQGPGIVTTWEQKAS